MARIAVVFLGGTISSVYDPVAGGNVPTLDGTAIIARTPGLEDLAELVPVDLPRIPASHLPPSRIAEIGLEVQKLLDDPAMDGVVVVQGTDTIEETSFCWDVVLSGPKPVAVTGAMRAASEPGFDGPANLRHAVLVASSPLVRGAGVMVVLAGTIEAADDVQKTHATSLTTFRSPNSGSIGAIERDTVVVWRERVGRRHVDTRGASDKVHLITAVTGIDGTLLDAAVAAGGEGIVVAATGSGNTSATLLDAAARAMDAGVPVALTTRCLGGGASPGYAFPGGGATWVKAGALVAGHLSGPKARIALALGVGAGLDREGLARLLSDPAPATA